MLVLEGRDSAAEAAAFRAAGIGDFDLFNFGRDAKRPDGTPTKVASRSPSRAMLQAPDIGYFTCQQHHPENFWNPAFQQHANGATGIAGIVLVADRPTIIVPFSPLSPARASCPRPRPASWQKLRAAKSR